MHMYNMCMCMYVHVHVHVHVHVRCELCAPGTMFNPPAIQVFGREGFQLLK